MPAERSERVVVSGRRRAGTAMLSPMAGFPCLLRPCHARRLRRFARSQILDVVRTTPAACSVAKPHSQRTCHPLTTEA